MLTLAKGLPKMLFYLEIWPDVLLDFSVLSDAGLLGSGEMIMVCQIPHVWNLKRSSTTSEPLTLSVTSKQNGRNTWWQIREEVGLSGVQPVLGNILLTDI